MEAKLPVNPFEQNMKAAELKTTLTNADILDIAAFTSYAKGQLDALKFFVDFLDEHIELCKSRQIESTTIVALKINFKNRFMD